MASSTSYMTHSINLTYNGIFHWQQGEEEEESAGDELESVEPRLILLLRSEADVEGEIVTHQVESQHSFHDCTPSFLISFIKNNEPLPMDALMNAEAAEITRLEISNLIAYLVRSSAGVAGLRNLQVDVIYKVFEEQEEEEDDDPRDEVDVLRERRMDLMRKDVSSRSSMADEELCAVCLEGMVAEAGEEVVWTPCTHQFHAECVGRWFEKSGSCPICRFDFGP